MKTPWKTSRANFHLIIITIVSAHLQWVYMTISNPVVYILHMNYLCYIRTWYPPLHYYLWCIPTKSTFSTDHVVNMKRIHTAVHKATINQSLWQVHMFFPHTPISTGLDKLILILHTVTINTNNIHEKIAARFFCSHSGTWVYNPGDVHCYLGLALTESAAASKSLLQQEEPGSRAAGAWSV